MKPRTSRQEAWLSLGFALPSSNAGIWDGVHTPPANDVVGLLNISVCENGDKPTFQIPDSVVGRVTRTFRGSFDASTGQVYLNTGGSPVAINTLTLSQYDWLVVSIAGSYGFDGNSPGSAKTQGQFFLYDGSNWIQQATCPQLDVPDVQWNWQYAQAALNFQKAMLRAGRKPKGHALHYAGFWHSAPPWLSHTLWNLPDEAAAKAFLANYFHRRASALAGHYRARKIEVIQTDAINEVFDTDLTTNTGTKLPGLRDFTRTYPYNSSADPWMYAASLITAWGATNQDRVLSLFTYVFQTVRKYFPTARIGFNDFSLSAGLYYINDASLTFTDVNGNPQTAKYWVSQSEAQKRHAMHYWHYLLAQRGSAVVVGDAAKDADAVYAFPDGMGFQAHNDPKNFINMGALAYDMDRLAYFHRPDGQIGLEAYCTEVNAVAEVTKTQADASVTVSGGQAGASIQTLVADFPTQQTATSVSLISSAINWGTSDAATAAALAAAINAGNSTHHYNAQVDTTTLTLVHIWPDTPKGFDLGLTTGGTITATTTNSRVGSLVSNMPPQFAGIYQATRDPTKFSTSWIFGWTEDNKIAFKYASWVTESFLRLFLRHSRARMFRFWTPGLDAISLWDFDYDQSPMFAATKRVFTSVDAIAPEGRVIANRCLHSWNTFVRLYNTQTNCTLLTATGHSGPGAQIAGAAGENSIPWAWFSRQGIASNDCAAIIKFEAPGLQAAGVRVATISSADHTNRVALFFKNATDGQVWMHAFSGSVQTVADTQIGLVNSGEPNVIALEITPTGLKASLNGAAVVSVSGAVSSMDDGKANCGFDHNNANGYVSSVFQNLEIYDVSAIANDAALVALSVWRPSVNVWPPWDGTGSQPALVTEDDHVAANVPGIPTLITIIASKKVITPTFTATTIAGIGQNSTQMQYRTANNLPYDLPVTVTTGHEVTGLTNAGTDWYIRFRSVNSDGYGPWTAPDIHVAAATSFADTFAADSDQNLTADANYVALSGATETLGVRSGKLAKIAQATRADVGTLDIGLGVGTYVQAQIAATQSITTLYVAANITDVNNFIGVRRNTTKWDLVQCKAGTITVLGSFTGAAANDTVRIEIAGTLSAPTARLLVNAVEKVAATAFDVSLVGTRHGFVDKNAAITGLNPYLGANGWGYGAT